MTFSTTQARFITVEELENIPHREPTWVKNLGNGFHRAFFGANEDEAEAGDEEKPRLSDRPHIAKEIKRHNRDNDPFKGKRRGGAGAHGTEKGKKGYNRKEKHNKSFSFWTVSNLQGAHKEPRDESQPGFPFSYPEGYPETDALTPADETYRAMNFPLASLTWSTHEPETFKDTGKKGALPAWGLKSIIDRGVTPHEKKSGDKNIGRAEDQTQTRKIPSKKFRSYSSMDCFYWS